MDVIGDEALLGKPVGSDERNQKSTYVTLTSLEEAKKLAAEAAEEAVNSLKIFDKEPFLKRLIHKIKSIIHR